MPGSETDDTILRDLVEGRLEAPDVEYKNWLDLSDAVARAKTARHICALANYGGGHLVFGFDDDGAPSGPRPADLSGYNQDVVNGIVDRYLVPPLHCAVHMVAAIDGLRYPVVRVPSHGAQPVCAKSDGPQEKGRPVGISKGVHYVRVSGPKSEPISTPELWRDVIRRCVVAERDALLGSISRLFDQPVANRPGSDLPPLVDDALGVWPQVAAEGWPVATTANRVAFGFRLVTSAGAAPQAVPIGELRETARSAAFAASDEVNDGLVPFEQGWKEGLQAHVALFGEVEGYERRGPAAEASSLASFWRLASDGKGVEVNVLPEDMPSLRESIERRGSRRWPAGGRISARFQVQYVAQRLAFVRNLASAYGAEECEFVLDYLGLAGRRLDEPAAGFYFSRHYVASIAGRRVALSISLPALAADLPSATASLLAPVIRLFDGWEINADYVRTVLAGGR